MSTTVLISGLRGVTVAVEQVRVASAEHGNLLDVQMLSRETKAMVTFGSKGEAESAVTGLNGNTISRSNVEAVLLSQPVSVKGDMEEDKILRAFKSLTPEIKVSILTQLQTSYMAQSSDKSYTKQPVASSEKHGSFNYV